MRQDQKGQFNKASFKKVHWSDPQETGVMKWLMPIKSQVEGSVRVSVSVSVYFNG